MVKLNNPRCGHSSCSFGDSIYVFGGQKIDQTTGKIYFEASIEKLCKALGPQSSTSPRWTLFKISKFYFIEGVTALNSKEIVIFGSNRGFANKIWILNSEVDQIRRLTFNDNGEVEYCEIK